MVTETNALTTRPVKTALEEKVARLFWSSVYIYAEWPVNDASHAAVSKHYVMEKVVTMI